MPSFFNGKRFCLTYAQHCATPDEMLQFFESKGELASYVIGQEFHADGGLHIHAAVEFISHQRKPVSWLDHDGKHPSIEPPRNWAAWKNYCKKDGQFIESSLEDDDAATQIDYQEKVKISTENEWMQYCISKKISFQYARWFWDRYNNDFTTLQETDEFEGHMVNALRTLDYEPGPTAWIINGPTGCGKTTWAKRNAVKPCLFVSHLDQLKKFVPGHHKSIIFDDISVTHIHREAQIHLLDFENPRAIHCRHAIASIPAGVFKIFTCNNWPVNKGDPAIDRRAKYVNINLLMHAVE